MEAELAQADREVPGGVELGSGGDLFAHIVLLKGLPGPAESAGGGALSGPDGDAARKALAALGIEDIAVFSALTRPESSAEPESTARRVRRIVEAIDPVAVVALDADAAADLARAFGVRRIPFGKPVQSLGRTLLAVDGLEASLVEPARKRRVWAQFKRLQIGRSLL
ncbi:MAG: hypothetical protein OEV43_00945 [Coriobacteriia bacterium]|nr:hypothetical protein [Coriobacteriia bacterium]